MPRYFRGQSDQFNSQDKRKLTTAVLKETLTAIDTSNVPRYSKKQFINDTRQYIANELSYINPHTDYVQIIEGALSHIRKYGDKYGVVIRDYIPKPPIKTRPKPTKKEGARQLGRIITKEQMEEILKKLRG